MTVTFAASCVCGAVVAYEGDRRGERDAKDAWAAEHAEHGAPVAVVAPEPAVEPEAKPEPKPSRRQTRGASA